jgi:hypothetical protein
MFAELSKELARQGLPTIDEDTYRWRMAQSIWPLLKSIAQENRKGAVSTATGSDSVATRSENEQVDTQLDRNWSYDGEHLTHVAQEASQSDARGEEGNTDGPVATNPKDDRLASLATRPQV